ARRSNCGTLRGRRFQPIGSFATATADITYLDQPASSLPSGNNRKNPCVHRSISQGECVGGRAIKAGCFSTPRVLFDRRCSPTLTPSPRNSFDDHRTTESLSNLQFHNAERSCTATVPQKAPWGS